MDGKFNQRHSSSRSQQLRSCSQSHKHHLSSIKPRIPTPICKPFSEETSTFNSKLSFSSNTEMAHHRAVSSILMPLLLALSLMSGKEVFASRHLLEEPTLPEVPEHPEPELPPLPTVPTLPKPELPPLPTVPTLPKPELPPLPKVELPPLPHIPTVPEQPKPELPTVPALEKPELPPLPKLVVPKIPELPKPTLPTVPTLPKDIPIPSLSPPHSTTSP